MAIPIFKNKIRLPSSGFVKEYLGLYTQPGSLTTFNFNVLLGAPDPTREIIGCVLCRNSVSSPRTISSGFLYGSGSSMTVQVMSSGFQIGGTRVSAIRIDAPAGIQNGLLSLTMSGAAADHCTVSLFRVVKRQRRGGAETDFGSDGGTFGTNISTNACTVNPGGFLIGIGGHSNTNPNSLSGADLLGDILTAGGSATANFWRCIDTVSVTPTVQLSWSSATGSIIGAWSFDG